MSMLSVIAGNCGRARRRSLEGTDPGHLQGSPSLNVALGGTLKLDIPGHKLPEMKDRDVQLCAMIVARSIVLEK